MILYAFNTSFLRFYYFLENSMSLIIVKHSLNGKWIELENAAYIDVENPSTREVLTGIILVWFADHIN